MKGQCFIAWVGLMLLKPMVPSYYKSVSVFSPRQPMTLWLWFFSDLLSPRAAVGPSTCGNPLDEEKERWVMLFRGALHLLSLLIRFSLFNPYPWQWGRLLMQIVRGSFVLRRSSLVFTMYPGKELTVPHRFLFSVPIFHAIVKKDVPPCPRPF